VVDEAVIEVLATQVGVSGGGLDLEDTLLNGQERDIESATTEIEDQDVALALNLLVKTVSDGSSRGFVDNSENVQAGNETSILGGLALSVVEVGRDGDDSVVDCATEVGLSGLAHLGQNHGGDLLRCEGLRLSLVFDLDDGLATLVDDLEGEVLHISLDLRIIKLAANQTLGVEDCVLGVHGDLVLGGISDQTLGICEGDEGRRCPVTLVIGNDFNSVISVDTDARICRAQVNTDGSDHGGQCVMLLLKMNGLGSVEVMENRREDDTGGRYKMEVRILGISGSFVCCGICSVEKREEVRLIVFVSRIIIPVKQEAATPLVYFLRKLLELPGIDWDVCTLTGYF